jgi:hypothetical protein
MNHMNTINDNINDNMNNINDNMNDHIMNKDAPGDGGPPGAFGTCGYGPMTALPAPLSQPARQRSRFSDNQHHHHYHYLAYYPVL